MSRTALTFATAAVLTALAAPALAGAPDPTPAPTVATRAPADAQTRAAYDRADALTRSVFWNEQAGLDPNDAAAGIKAAQALRELGRYGEAAQAAQKVLLVHPGQSDALLEVGRAQIAGGQAFYGIAALEQARDARPQDWRAWSLLGTAYEQVRRPDDARAAWAQALALSPDNAEVLTNMAVSALSKGDAASAEPLLRRAATQPDASLKVRLNLALALGLNGRMGEAEAILRRDLPPEQADANLAWLRARNGSTPATGGARTWSSLQGG